MAYSIGTLSNITGIRSYSGFDLPSDATVVRLLSSGSTDYNAVLQSSGTSFPVAVISGITESSSDIAALRAYRKSHASFTFVDFSTSHTVCMTEFDAAQNDISGLWTWTATLVEVAAYVAPE